MFWFRAGVWMITNLGCILFTGISNKVSNILGKSGGSSDGELFFQLAKEES